ncbi:MAG: hypothetical protein M1822_006458 [Bathelium mastoideum]|nr:MAG: hypothetical protein M1822_006458 [Bathelium mastoideum]
MKSLSNPLACVLLAATATARSVQDSYNWRSAWHLPGRDSQAPPQMGNATFEQLIDHNNASLGTFSQFYYYSTEFWQGPGSPVILFTPGEINVTGYQSYLSTNRTTGVEAQKIGAAVIVLEHRYWGMSSPFSDLTTANMTYLTLPNAIADLTYFAQNAVLPFTEQGQVKSNAADVPWVLMGGSYSGNLAAWTQSVAPGTFWAYHASSAPVEAVSDYYGYFLPVQLGMPANCSSDLSQIVDYIDGVFTNGSATEIANLKAMFKLSDLEADDVGAALENGPWLWQGNQFYTNYSAFFQFCDYIEGAITTSSNGTTDIPTNYTAPASGVGLQKALQGYVSWWTTVQLPGYCEGYGAEFNGIYNTACLDTHNASNPLFTDTSLSNAADRQWVWMTCNEPFGYWQDGAPTSRPSIVSRLVTADYWIRQCALYFPTGPDGQTYGIAAGRTEADVNAYTGGWNLAANSTRLIFANGGFDPWREATVSSDLRPGGPVPSSVRTPINIVPGGFHTSDLVTQNGAVNASCQAVIDKEVQQLADWVAEWPGSRTI